MAEFVDIGSKQVFRAPYTAAGVSMFGFPIKSDNPAALVDYCDRAFNRPSGGQLKYRPLLPYVLLTFADISRLYSSEPPDLDVGWDPERDVIFWLLVVDEKLDAKAPFLTWCVPFIFVNNPQAVLTGREVLGFPKEFATVNMQRGETVPIPFSVVANVYPKFNRDTEVVWANVMTLKSQGDGEPGHPWGRLEDALAAVGLDAFSPAMQCIFLKQFRGPQNDGKACYQGIIQSGFVPKGFRGGGILPGRYQLELQHYDSHPFARDLGLTQSVYRDLRGGWLNFDFDLTAGQVIWEAL